jgi:type I restriction enzyme, S subunit
MLEYKTILVNFREELMIPNDWNFSSLENICTKIKAGGTPKSDKKIYYNGKIPFCSISDLTKSEKFLENTSKTITEKGLENSAAWIVPSNSILYSMYATVGKPLINKIDTATHQGILGIIPNNRKIDTEFLFYSLLPLKRKLVRYFLTNTQSNINLKISKNLKIIFPSNLKEQQKIVKILSDVDSQIKNKHKIISTIKLLKKGLIQKLMSEGISNTKFQEYFYTKNGVILLGSIPKNWNVFTIQKLVETKHILEFQDGNHGELHPSNNDFSTEGKSFVTATQIDKNGKINLDQCKKLPESFCGRLRIGFCQANDVLFTHNATVGRVAILPSNSPDCIIGTSVTYYRIDPKKMDRLYFSYILQSDFIKKQYATEMDQSTRQQYSIQKQAKLRIPIPLIQEQQKISSILSNIDSQIQFQIKFKEKLEHLKKSLMQKLLTGEIQVKV